jgi:hypothetical protein
MLLYLLGWDPPLESSDVLNTAFPQLLVVAVRLSVQ